MAPTKTPDRDAKARTEPLEVVEEEVRVDKAMSTTGRVQVQTLTDEVQEIVEQSLTRDDVQIDRVPINQEISSPPETRTENGVLIVPIVEEILVIEKRLMLKEELHIRRETVTENTEIPVTLRKQRAVVKRRSPDESGPQKES